MVHEDYKQMIPAHALLALDAAEARALDGHLSECAECRMELEEWEATASALAVTAEPMEPSPELRDRILNEVRKDVSARRVIPFRSDARNVWSAFGSLGAIAAAVLVGVLLIGLIVLWQQNRAAKSDLATLSAQLEQTRKELERTNQFLQFVSKPDAKVADLAGTGNASSAIARLAYDTKGRALLIANGLPNVPEGKVYQLWFIVPGKPPIPGKTFAPDTVGNAVSTDQMPQAALDATVFAVTLEPAGGVGAPTGPMYLSTIN